MNMKTGQFLYPNVSTVPGQSGVGGSEKSRQQDQAVKGEFDSALKSALNDSKSGQLENLVSESGSKADLSQVRNALKFSSHASQRLNERKIQLDAATMTKVNDAIDKAAAKGLEDALVLTPNAALIVSVNNRTVITAMDRTQLQGNVFTNIDGAVVI